MKIKIIACEVIKEELLSIQPAYETEFSFIPMGLHLYPNKLNAELQKRIDASEGYSRIVLSFGLCGGAARTLHSKSTPLTIPRVHDCIPLLLGSRGIFETLRKEEPGTFFYSCGWFKGERTFLSEYKALSEKHGEAKALKALRQMYDGYKKVIFIHTGHPEEEASIPKSKQVAEILKLDFTTMEGRKEYISRIVRGPWEEGEFITVPSGEELKDSLF